MPGAAEAANDTISTSLKAGGGRKSAASGIDEHLVAQLECQIVPRKRCKMSAATRTSREMIATDRSEDGKGQSSLTPKAKMCDSMFRFVLFERDGRDVLRRDLRVAKRCQCVCCWITHSSRVRVLAPISCDKQAEFQRDELYGNMLNP